MALGDDLKADVGNILKTEWNARNGQEVPEPEDVSLGNDAVRLEATVLYADLADSTALVSGHKWWFAAEVYKAFLHCAAKIIKDEEGAITAYDGDRIMAVYIGDSKSTAAVRAAMRIKYAVREIINPAIAARYQDTSYRVQYACGVDTSTVYAVRTGVRGNNDLVWVGLSANHAAALCAMRDDPYTTWITAEIYNTMNKTAKYANDGTGELMWVESRCDVIGRECYKSNWQWRV